MLNLSQSILKFGSTHGKTDKSIWNVQAWSKAWIDEELQNWGAQNYRNEKETNILSHSCCGMVFFHHHHAQALLSPPPLSLVRVDPVSIDRCITKCLSSILLKWWLRDEQSLYSNVLGIGLWLLSRCSLFAFQFVCLLLIICNVSRSSVITLTKKRRVCWLGK